MLTSVIRVMRHSAVYSLGALAEKGVAFFLVPLYTRFLSPADYGVLGMMVAVMAPLMILSEMGVTNGLAMTYYDSKEKSERAKAVGTALTIAVIGAVVLSAVTLAAAGSLSQLFFDTGKYTLHFRLIAFASLFEVLLLVLLSTLRVQEKSRQYVLIILFKFLLSAGMNVIFITVLGWGVRGLLISMAIAPLAVAIPLGLATAKNTGFGLSRVKAWHILHFGFPIMPAGLMSQVMGLSDRYMLQFMVGTAEVGLYSLGAQFGAIVGTVLVTPFLLAWGPFFWAVAKEPNALEIYARITTYYFLVTVSCTVALALLAKEMMIILTAPDFHSSYRVVGFLAGTSLLRGAVSPFMASISLARKTKWVPLVMAGATVVNLGLNYIMIQWWDMVGAALATMLSCALLPLGTWLIGRRYHSIQYEWGRISKIVLVGAFVLLAGWFIDTGQGAVPNALVKIMVLLLLPIGLYLTGFFRREELQKMKEWIRI